jgi:hypothetical protein
MGASINNFAGRLHRMQPSAADAPRRTTHGSCAWTLPFGTTTLRQPQDGALTGPAQPVSSTRLKQLRPHAAPDTEDDRLSGATRSLSNRILGLNGFTARRPLLEAEPERYFAEPLRMTKPEPLRKAKELVRRATVQATQVA